MKGKGTFSLGFQPLDFPLFVWQEGKHHTTGVEIEFSFLFYFKFVLMLLVVTTVAKIFNVLGPVFSAVRPRVELLSLKICITYP